MTNLSKQNQISIPAKDLSTHLYQLESRNKELIDDVKERRQSLIMHLSLPQIKSISNYQKIQTMLLSLQELQLQFENNCSNSLMNAQIKAQQESQMNELIKDYEKRIYGLRVSLVDKEGDIGYQIGVSNRTNIPRKQNIQNFNFSSYERQLLTKTLKEIKKLKVEINALEHGLAKSYLSQSQKRNQVSTKNVSIIQNSSLEKTQNISRIAIVPGDMLIQKVYQSLQDEIDKNKKLESKYEKLQEQEKQINNKKKNLVLKYTNLQNQKKNNQKIISSTVVEQQNVKKQFLLFSQIDKNVVNKNQAKGVTTLKQRRNNKNSLKRQQNKKENIC